MTSDGVLYHVAHDAALQPHSDRPADQGQQRRNVLVRPSARHRPVHDRAEHRVLIHQNNKEHANPPTIATILPEA